MRRQRRRTRGKGRIKERVKSRRWQQGGETEPTQYKGCGYLFWARAGAQEMTLMGGSS